MEFKIKNYEIRNTIQCKCGYQFSMKDFTELKRINEPGFYANQVKHYSPTKCPACKIETTLLLKQVGQTYVVVDTAILKKTKDNQETENVITEPTSKIETEKEISQKFICPECEKVCKNQLGLNAHMRTHQN